MSLQEAATTVDASARSTRTPTPDDDEGIAYNFSTSLIVRTAVAAGIIVLVLTALVLFFNISQWLRNRRRRLERRHKSRRRQMDQRASKYEMAAWIGTDAVDIVDDRDDGYDFSSWTRGLFRRRNRKGIGAVPGGAERDRRRQHGRRGKKDRPRDVRDGRNAFEVEEPDEGHAQ